MASELQCIDIARAAHLEGGRRSGREILFVCPNHEDRHPSLSINPTKNVWACWPCAASGTAWQLAAFLIDADPSDIRSVAGWLREKGLIGGNWTRGPQMRDTRQQRQTAALRAVREWARRARRKLRDEFLSRQRIILYAQEKLHADPVSEIGWELLRIAFDGEARNEFLLDEIDLCSTDAEHLRAWREYHHDI